MTKNGSSERLLGASRSAAFPDYANPARASSTPALGPSLLFFSGGSALNDIAVALKGFTHNSVHMITPFDSGGSSQVLRQAFDMPAVGDLRSRLVALADDSKPERVAVRDLFAYRLPREALAKRTEQEFRSLLEGSHPLMSEVEPADLEEIRSMLSAFDAFRPRGFDFRHASVGNLIFAGGYLLNDRELEPVLALMSEMAGVLGEVRAIADVNLQVGVELEDGRQVIGQAEFTGKDRAPIGQPVRRLFLADATGEIDPDRVQLPSQNARKISRANLICYPPGSLFSSVIVNLLPQGAGRAIAGRNVPKVYVPSLGADPECFGMTLEDQVDAILSVLRQDAGGDRPAGDLLNLILTDTRALDLGSAERIRREHRIDCVTLDLAQEGRSDCYDPEKICKALVALT